MEAFLAAQNEFTAMSDFGNSGVQARTFGDTLRETIKNEHVEITEEAIGHPTKFFFFVVSYGILFTLVAIALMWTKTPKHLTQIGFCLVMWWAFECAVNSSIESTELFAQTESYIEKKCRVEIDPRTKAGIQLGKKCLDAFEIIRMGIVELRAKIFKETLTSMIPHISQVTFQFFFFAVSILIIWMVLKRFMDNGETRVIRGRDENRVVVLE